MFLDIVAVVGLVILIIMGLQIMTDLTRIQSEVAENTTVVDSAVALLGNLSALIRENATDPEALNAIADSLDSNSNKLAAAVAANTPATNTTTEEIPAEDLEPIEEPPVEE